MHSRWVAPVAALVVTGLLAAGCGEDDDASGTTGAASTVATTGGASTTAPGSATAAGSTTAGGSGDSTQPTFELTNAPQGFDGTTLKIGLQTPVTGPTSSSFGEATVNAAKARIELANDTGELPAGVKIELVTADEMASPETGLAASKQLVESDKVWAILAAGASSFEGAYRYTGEQGIPVFGTGLGKSYGDPANENLFTFLGPPNQDYPSFAGFGEYFKSKGATAVCGLGFAQSQTSVSSTTAMVKSAEAEGLETPYLNVTLPFTGVDWTSVALAMKDAGCDAVTGALVSGAFAGIMTALRDVGVDVKATMLFAAYAQEFIDDPGAREALQGAGGGSFYSPWHVNTPATKRMQDALKKYAGWDKPAPAAGMQWGWFSADLAIRAIRESGGDLSWDNVITKMRAVTGYDAGGLICPVDLGRYDFYEPGPFGANCNWISRLEGDGYVAENDGEPVRIETIAGTKNAAG